MQPMVQGKTSANPTQVPRIFDEPLLATRLERAARRTARRGPSFLLARMVDDLAERLHDVTRTFGSLLLIAPYGTDTLLRERLSPAKTPAAITLRTPAHHTRLGLPAESFDLVVALLGPGMVNDLPGALIEARRLLQPDGLLIAAWLGGQTLTELRAALYADDEARRGGLSPRVHPGVDHHQAAQLLGRAGLALPVVDTDRLTVRYGALQTLVDDIRDLGLSNALVARDPHFLGKATLRELARRYPVEEGRYPATFEVLWLTGWAPHADQPVPLKPGSATTRLADALGTTERKL